jgi:diguanylate cyclase (GGDEF)-like protein
VIAIATSRSDASATSGGRRPDFAARLKGRGRSLRARVESRDAILEGLRESHATLEPERVAEWLVQQADAWVAAPCWAVVVRTPGAGLTVLANRGLTTDLGLMLEHAADWVLRNRAELFTADLSRDRRNGSHVAGTAVGFPLVARGQIVGALLGVDPQPSAAAPALGPGLVAAIRAYLEAPALALDNALQLRRVEALSVIDDLTRLFNYRYLHQALRREIKRGERHQRPISLIFLDLDGFKEVNDTYGHLAGSKALVEVGAVLKNGSRETDVVARFGGDEFAVVLPETGLIGAMAVASRLRERITSSRFLAADGMAVRLTASIGVATLPDVAGSAEELLRAADKAMYRVKASGKDGIQAAQAEPDPEPGHGTAHRRS